MMSRELTEYERRRLENMKRNNETLASLNVNSKLTQLSAAVKRLRAQNNESTEKTSKTKTPSIIRRSLRCLGMPPKPLELQTHKNSLLQLGPLNMRDAYIGTVSDQNLVKTILNDSKKSQLSCTDSSIDSESINGNLGCTKMQSRVWGSIDSESLRLEPANVAWVLQGDIRAMQFFPSTDLRMIVVGSKSGNVGLWNVDSRAADGNGIYVYQPYSQPVMGIAIHPFFTSKIFSCCYGCIRLVDVEKETLDLVYSSGRDFAHGICSLSQRPNDVKSLYFGECHGSLHVWDERAGKSSSSWNLHGNRINTIDFNSGNTNIMATSSTDCSACIWDLRYIDAH